MRGASRPHHRVTDYATLRRYLIYLATPLADWTTRYTTLRQVTEADVTAAVTAVKGPRAHERAVAIRSLFRALKHTKLVFADPARGVRITRQELLPTTLAPDRLAGLLETSSNPATRLVLALVALHATSGTDLRNLDLSDVLLTRRQLLIRRPPAVTSSTSTTPQMPYCTLGSAIATSVGHAPSTRTSWSLNRPPARPILPPRTTSTGASIPPV